jgi:hypothetical protein
LYSSPNRVKEDEMGGHVAWMGEKRTYMKDFGGKRERKRPLERPRYGCQNNINMEYRKIWWGSMDCIHLVDSKRFIRWRITHRITRFLDFFHRLVF